MTKDTVDFFFYAFAECKALEELLRRKGLLDDNEFNQIVASNLEKLKPMAKVIYDTELANVRVKFEEVSI